MSLDGQECDSCGDTVLTLSTEGLCDGCVEMWRMDTPEELAAAFEKWAASDGPVKLQAELDELERTDPKVRAAAESYDRMVEQVTGRELPRRAQ